MERGTYERLSGLDEAFLAFETPTTYMHVAVSAVFETGSLGTGNGGVDIKRIRAHVGSRLRFIPRYRQRIHLAPLTGDAIWVDDDDFDLGYHVRHCSLPRPGGERQMQLRVAEILERPLDRSRPLWEIWIIEGLAGGRFAMVAKVHHCMVDGIAGIDILAALLGTEPTDEVEKAERWTPRPPPSERELMRDEIRRRTRASIGVARRLRSALQQPAKASREVGTRAAAIWRLVTAGVRGAPATPFNDEIGAHRRVDWLAMDLAEVRELKTRLGATLNDIVLATVAGAARRFLQHRRHDTAIEDFRVLVPVSTRATAEQGALGNRVSIWVVPLPVNHADPLAQVAVVRETTLGLKDSNQAAGAEAITQAVEWTGAGVRNLLARLIHKSHQYNLIVTNVPGPSVPFYLLGARMVSVYPHVPLFENQGLGIALLSYDGKLYWGLTADWNLLPDIGHFARALSESFQELRLAAGLDAEAAPAPTLISEPPVAKPNGHAARMTRRRPSGRRTTPTRLSEARAASSNR